MTDTYGDCDLHCPPITQKGYCCRRCYQTRRDWYEHGDESIKQHWSDAFGFLAPDQGCRLPRNLRPPECLEYNCANQLFIAGMVRQGHHWPVITREMPKEGATAEEFLAQARDVWQDLHGMGLMAEEPEQSSWDLAIQHADGPTLYLLHGLLGSGKSTWARRLVEKHPRARIVCADDYRKMLHGTYQYDEKMDPVITENMVAAIKTLQAQGYDVIVDNGNQTKERRLPFIEATCGPVVAVVFPQMHTEWHVARRLRAPHWQKPDWRQICEDEKKALEPIQEDDTLYATCIDVPLRDVCAQKILILSASPVRDKYIDELIARKLRAKGHIVKIAACLREGRQAVMEFKPNICLVPPVRNPYSRDFVAVLKRNGVAVVTRHTEPSCSWQDWHQMTPEAKTQICGAFQYTVDLELVWSSDEADILNRRQGSAPVIPVGAIGLDIYFDEELKRSLVNKSEFLKKHNFDPQKRTLLITSPWGFADSSPDLSTDEMCDARAEQEGREKHVAMIAVVAPQLQADWNILLTVHSGIGIGPYQALAKKLGLPLDTDSPMLDMLPHVDAIVHAGSTAAVSAHLLGIPGFQYGDVNAASVDNWWGIGESAISRVSPRFETAEQLAEAIRQAPAASNANPATLKELEEGRYGLMDGRATDRAIEHILRLSGYYQPAWPQSPHDYRQLTVQRREQDFFTKVGCAICGESYCLITDEYVSALAVTLGVPKEKLRPKHGIHCPHCAAKMQKV